MKNKNKIIINLAIGITGPVIFFIIHYLGLYIFTGTFIKDESDVFEVTISWFFMHGLLIVGSLGIPLGLILFFNKNYIGYNWIALLLFGISSFCLIFIYPF